LNNIENKPVSETAAALARLSAALERLERAAARRPAGVGAEVTALRQEADDLARRHAALKKSAGQVAVRLDDTIRRLSTIMDQEG
jgi:hypothetical protein